MAQHIRQINKKDFPPLLQEIADPPTQLYVKGNITPLSSPATKCLAVVGSRKCTSYGRDVVNYLIEGLAGHPVSIISGLALGIDAYAHKAALEAQLHTVAVPGSGLDEQVLYPRSHVQLAREILENDGGLVSEFEPTQNAAPWTFPKRNRIMAGMAHAVLIIEAAERSGTLITARLATEYNRDLLVVPASIFADSSKGAHQFLKLGATPVTTPADILTALLIEAQTTAPSEMPYNFSSDEQLIYDALHEPLTRDELLAQLPIPTTQANILLSKLELDGVIVEKLGTLRRRQ